MMTIKIDGQQIHAKQNQTILQIAKREGIEIPTICHLPGLESRSVCRICSVELKGQERLFPACSTVIEPDMEIETQSRKVVDARRVLMEFIIAEHGGLQSLSSQIRAYAGKLGVKEARLYIHNQKDSDCNRYSSDYIRITQEKCILCDRCIASCRDHHVISRAKRGSATLLTFGDNNSPLDETSCTHCGDCVVSCPTGAISEYR